MKNKNRELTELEKDFIKEKESEGYKIIVQDNKIILKCEYDEDNVIGIAKCNPEDKFDIKIGVEVAKRKRQIQRLHQYNEYHRKEIKKLEKEYKYKINEENRMIKNHKKIVNQFKREIYQLTKGDK